MAEKANDEVKNIPSEPIANLPTLPESLTEKKKRKEYLDKEAIPELTVSKQPFIEGRYEDVIPVKMISSDGPKLSRADDETLKREFEKLKREFEYGGIELKHCTIGKNKLYFCGSINFFLSVLRNCAW
ncbi:uncharacterized protein LOC132746893 [Ruditapes philippinarum]|uniref:uncharacterized protein LOC132746893 n=1 Tax=Ruditapes philippinarum TaxID=129788 RepID=UPI00295AFEDD|nr:uncharacterized protein LOC132746893 [Ruditapes philippinarum]